MLAKPNRLRTYREFAAVHQQGIRRSSAHLILKALPRRVKTRADSSGVDLPTRVGISISQKVSKRATVRNRIKRQLRAAWRRLLPRLPGGWDFVVVVRPGMPPCDYPQFLQELEQLLVTAELLNGH